MDIVDSSDRSLLVRLSGHTEVLALARSLEQGAPNGVTSYSPAYATVLVRYDPILTQSATIKAWLDDAAHQSPPTLEPREVIAPAIFDGPDLVELAAAKHLKPDEVIRIFCSTAYRVYFFGFVPGFAYMGEVDERIAMPRRSAPRKNVPAGSIGIAGRQTGVYPAETPGGWNLIGRCTTQWFDPHREPACLAQPGDTVRFEPA